MGAVLRRNASSASQALARVSARLMLYMRASWLCQMA